MPVEKAAAEATPELPLCEACGGEHALDLPHISEMVEAATGGDDQAQKSVQGEASLTPEQQQALAELKRVDQEVRQHEHAHQAVAGGLSSGGASYTYETGADGKHYAVGGEVSISLREGRTEEETIRLARQVRRAALAPASPSAQDQRVASQASKMISEAEQGRRAEDKLSETAGGLDFVGQKPDGQKIAGRPRR